MAQKGWGGKSGGKGGMVPMSMNDFQGLMMSMMNKGRGGWGDSFNDTMQRIKKMEDDKKVYVEGIAEGVKWKDLQKHCEEAGHKPVLCEVMKGGRGVIAFKEASAAVDAIAALNQTSLNGQPITTDVWTRTEKTEEEKKEGGRSGGKGGGWGGNRWGMDSSKATLNKIQNAEDDRKAFVEGLPENATWKELETHFAEAGHKPALCEVTKGGKGVLLFKDAAGATAAIAALNGTTMGGNQITTDVWTKKEPSGEGGKSGGGRGKSWGSGGKAGGKGWNNNMNMMEMNPMMMAMMMKGNGGGGGGGFQGGQGGNKGGGGGWQGNAGGCAGGSAGGWGGNAGGFKGGNAGGKGGGWGGQGAAQPAQDLATTCVVSNLPSFIPIDEFKENLKQAGNVKSAKFSGAGRALVSYGTVAEANQCVQMFNGCEVGEGVTLKVHLAKQ